MTALVLAALLAVGGQTAGSDRILVMPFENLQREGRIFWLGEAAAVLLTDELRALGANPITRQERRQAFERLQVPPAADLTDATIIRIAQLVGAAKVILGTLELERDTLVVRTRSVVLESGRVVTNITVRGSLEDLFQTFERIAHQISPSSKPAEEIKRQRPPLAVFENFIKGLLAETPATAINYLNTVLKLQPTYDRARLALWEVYSEQNDHAKALAAVTPVAADSLWGRRARFLAGMSKLALKQYDDAFATFGLLAEVQPTPAVLNNQGVARLRRPATGVQSQTALASFFFKKAAEADPDDPDYLFNLGYASWQNHDTQAAIYWLREAVRRNPADGEAHFVLGAALAATGNSVEAGREKELAKRLSANYEELDKRSGTEPVPRGLERIKDEIELPHARRIEARLTASGQRDQKEHAAFYLDRARRLYREENDRDAMVELNHALYLSPYLADAHLLLGRIHLRNGRVHDASDAFKIALWSSETAEAHAALGEAYRQANNLAAAREEAQRALALDPNSTEANQLLARLDGR
jgi:tetratricopeptide (TPR) repeat protein